MNKWSFDDWCLKTIEKHNSQIRIAFKIGILVFLIGYLGYFINIGYQMGSNSLEDIGQTIIKGIICTVFFIVVFISFHFYADSELDFRTTGLPIGMAIGGVLIGIFGGFFNNIFGWVGGAMFGTPVIVGTTWWCYIKFKHKNDQ